MYKKFKRMSTVLCAVSMLSCISMTAFASNLDAQATETNPLDSGKEILYYLFWTQDDKLKSDLDDLQTEVGLSDQQMEELKDIGLNEHLENLTLSNEYASNTRSSISTFNNIVESNVAIRNTTISGALGEKEDMFREWILDWWGDEREYRMNPAQTRADVGTVSNIWATQYVPNTSGAREVALPDKYVKFANLGWDDTYPNPPYTVDVYSPDKGITLSDIAVDEVGPWNENDNYWDDNRRTFSDLDVGVPEAYAAYYNDYNGGKDESGRTVLNPAGIDLSTAAAKEIGFGTYESGFVEVTYDDLP